MNNSLFRLILLITKMKGSIIILNFRTEDYKWAKPISIHDGNILLKGIQMFKESINLTK